MESTETNLAESAVPTALDAGSVSALAALLAEGQSANTRRSYRTALRYWAAWFALRYHAPLALTVAPATVLQFIVDHALHREGETLRCELPEDIDRELIAQGYKGKHDDSTPTTVLFSRVSRAKVRSRAGRDTDRLESCCPCLAGGQD